jgi:hypothetical protein
MRAGVQSDSQAMADIIIYLAELKSFALNYFKNLLCSFLGFKTANQ